jgi:TP901 family phage tail tape measure protein
MSTVLEKTIEIIFQGDDRTQDALNGVIGRFDQLEKAVTTVSGPLAEMAEMVLKLEAALAAMALGGLAFAVNEAGNFDTQFREIATIAGVTGDELLDFRDDILDYAQGSTASLTSITGAIYESISRYTDYKGAIEVVTAAEELADAGRAELRATTILLSSAMAAYGADVDEAGRYSDVFFQIVKEGGTTLPQISEALSKVLSIAAAGKIPIEELGAAIATMTTQGGMETNEALTALARVIQAIIKPSSEATEAAKLLGIEFSLSALQSMGLGNYLGYVYEKADGNIEVLTKLFGNVKSFTGALALFGPDGGDAYLENLNKMYAAHGSSAEAAEIMKKSFDSINQTLLTNLSVTLVKWGEPLLGVYKDVIDQIIAILQNLSRAVDDKTFQPILDYIIKLGTDLSEYLAGISGSMSEAFKKVDWSGLIESFDKLMTVAKDLFKAVFPEDLTTADGLAKAIQKIVDTLEFLNNTTAKILTEFKPFFEALGTFMAKVGDADSGVAKFAETLASMLGKGMVVDMMVDKFGLLGGTVLGAFVNGMSLASKEGGILGDSMGEGAAAVAELEEGIRGKLLRTLLDYGVNVAEASTETEGLGNTISGFPEGIQIDFSAPGMLELQGALAAFGLTLNDIPREKIIELAAITDPVELHNAIAALGAIPDLKEVSVETEADPAALETTKTDIGTIPEEKDTDVYSRTDKDSLNTVQGQLEILAAKRVMEVEARADQYALEQMKAQFDLMQTAVEWKAKLDIAEVEANAEKVKAAFSALESVFTSSAEIISSALGALGGDFGAFGDSTRRQIFNVIERELDLRERAMSATEDLIQTQIDYMEAKMRAMSNGEALIQIDGAGLQPHLEAFMWEILGAIQTRVNEEGHAMLFGL